MIKNPVNFLLLLIVSILLLHQGLTIELLKINQFIMQYKIQDAQNVLTVKNINEDILAWNQYHVENAAVTAILKLDVMRDRVDKISKSQVLVAEAMIQLIKELEEKGVVK